MDELAVGCGFELMKEMGECSSPKLGWGISEQE